MVDLSPDQFHAEQVNKRLAGYRRRAVAAESNPDQWTVEVEHSSHDDLQAGRLVTGMSKVVLSREHHPDPAEAEQTAALMALARGHYVTSTRVQP